MPSLLYVISLGILSHDGAKQDNLLGWSPPEEWAHDFSYEIAQSQLAFSFWSKASLLSESPFPGQPAQGWGGWGACQQRDCQHAQGPAVPLPGACEE